MIDWLGRLTTIALAEDADSDDGAVSGSASEGASTEQFRVVRMSDDGQQPFRGEVQPHESGS